MTVYRVDDIDLSAIVAESYDVALFTNSHEERCTHVPQQISTSKVQRAVVLEARGGVRQENAELHTAFYQDHWNVVPTRIDADDEGPIYYLLRENTASGHAEARILVDYSSMSQLWYAGVLNWARYVRHFDSVIVDLVYAVGDHKEFTEPMVVDNILSVPGCEGGPIRPANEVAIFGLGFDGLAALTVLDRIEPDTVYAFYASPGAFIDYARRAKEANRELIESHAAAVLELPLGSVQATYRHLAELISPHLMEASISVVPMGPKPHVLSSILLSMRFPEITCLRVSSRDPKPENVGTSGDTVVTRVHFRSRPSPPAGWLSAHT